MGTTLTGTTPQDTYDSLIKVTDNGPISGTAKYLSDGLGNDSKLALSTGSIGINTTSPAYQLDVNGAARSTYNLINTGSSTAAEINFANTANNWSIKTGTTSNTFQISENQFGGVPLFITGGNVGIGTSTPVAKLQTTGTDAASIITGVALENFIATNPSSGNGVAVDFRLNNSGNTSVVAGKISTVNTFFRSNTDMVFSTFTSDALTEKARILSSGGITFNGDTAAANALDDYEEGTFTAVLNPSTSGTITLNATFNTWSYTKIGRQVTIKGLALVSSVASPVGAEVFISGLPFTILNSNSARGSASVTYLDNSTSTLSALANKHSINNTFLDIIIDASTVAANDEFYVTLTYFTA